MSTITNWTQGFLSAVSAALAQLLSAVPYIIGALLILVVGWIVAGFVGMLVVKLAHAVKVDTVGERIGVNRFLERSGTKMHASDIFGEIVKWVIRLVFIEMAAAQLGMAQVTLIINQIIAFIPNIIVAILVLGVGAFLGQVLGGVARGFAAESNVGRPELAAKIVNAAVLAFAVIAALNVLDIAPVVVNTLYIGLVAAIAIAIGLAFGLGGRDTAARLTERWVGQVETAQKTRIPTTTGTIVQPPVNTPVGTRQ